MRRLLAVDRLTWRLGLIVSAFVIGALAVGFHLTYLAYRGEMLKAARNHAETEARLVRLALSHEMLQSGDRSLVYGMVESFARETPQERIMVLDRDGIVRFSSDPTIAARHFRPEDPTCQVCHRVPGKVRENNVIMEIEGGTVLRSVQPILNRPICHECHEAEHRINGVLIVDVPVGPTMLNMEQAVRHLALGTTAVGLVLIGGIGFAFRRFLLRRLYRFETTALAIADGDLAQRVPVEGNDALTRLERAFNHMADSVVDLLTRVEAEGEHLRRMMNAVDDGMVVLDRNMLIVAANDAFLKRFPKSGVQMVGRPCWEAVAAAGMRCQTHDCPAHACFDSLTVHTSIETRTDGNGLTRHEEVRASPLYGDDGKVERVVEVWRDITDRRSAEARLAEFQRLASVGMLASGISHEVNTPLASIGTCLEAIDRTCQANLATSEPCQQVRGYVQIAAEQVRRCGGITKQFMQLARGRSPDAEILDLPSTAALVARLVSPTAKVAGVTIEVATDVAVPAVVSSVSSVQQVLLNLLMNAVEASHKGGAVYVTFAVTTVGTVEQIEVRVRDEGTGIAAGDLERVFEPFFSRRSRGTGLGLFVSLNLARGWGGDVRVLDSRPGQGSTFAAIFPHKPARPNTGDEAIPAAVPPASDHDVRA